MAPLGIQSDAPQPERLRNFEQCHSAAGIPEECRIFSNRSRSSAMSIQIGDVPRFWSVMNLNTLSPAPLPLIPAWGFSPETPPAPLLSSSIPVAAQLISVASDHQTGRSPTGFSASMMFSTSSFLLVAQSKAIAGVIIDTVSGLS